MQVVNIGSNRTELRFDDGRRVLVSYSTPVAAFVPGFGYYVTRTKHSRTTSKHINQWLGGNTRHEVDQSELNDMMERMR